MMFWRLFIQSILWCTCTDDYLCMQDAQLQEQSAEEAQPRISTAQECIENPQVYKVRDIYLCLLRSWVFAREASICWTHTLHRSSIGIVPLYVSPCLLTQTGIANTIRVSLRSVDDYKKPAMQALFEAHEGQPSTAQQIQSGHPLERTSTPAAEPILAPAMAQLHASITDTDQRKNGAPSLPPIPEEREEELPQMRQHAQAPSQALAASPPGAVKELVAPQEPEGAQVPWSMSPTEDPSLTSDSPPGFLMQSEAVHASLAACMEATPAQQQHGLPALTAQHIGSPNASSDPSSPVEAVVPAEEGLAEAADTVPEVVHIGDQHCSEPPHMSPTAEEPDVMGFSPGVNSLPIELPLKPPACSPGSLVCAPSTEVGHQPSQQMPCTG